MAGTMKLGRKESLLVCLLLLGHIALGIYYSVTIPIWEAHDEVGHYANLRYIATEKRLPPPGTQTAPAQDETHQPPLYYILAALPVSLIDLPDEIDYRPNRYVRYPDAQGGHNVAMHDPAAESWPYRGDVLGVHLARCVSVMLGGLVLLVVYQCGRCAWPDHPTVRWLATLTVALWPQFRFSSAVVNNDIAVTLAAAVALYGSIRLLRSRDTLRSLLVLALGVGMLALTKTNGLPLLLIPALALGITVAQRGGRRAILLGLGALVLGSLVAGWWYARNLAATGGLLAGPWNALWSLLTEKGTVPTALSGLTRWGSWWHALRTFWAGFGQNNVAYERWVYLAALGGVVPPVLGVICWFWRRPPVSQRIVVGLATIMVLVAFAVPQALWALRDWSHVQGRYLLPGLPALGLVLGLGWVSVGDALKSRWVPWVPLGAMAFLAILTPSLVIMPAYDYPKTLSSEELAVYHASQFRFGSVIDMVGWRIQTPAVDADGVFEAELVWQAHKPIWTMLVLSAKLYDDAGMLLSEVTRYPGNGSLATDTWEPGIYLEILAMPLAEPLGDDSHRAIWLDVSLYPRWTPDKPLAVFHADGSRIGSTLRLGPTKLRGANDSLEGLTPVSYRFGDALALRGLATKRDGDQLLIESGWRAEAAPTADLQISLQIRGAGNHVIAQADGALANGRLPTSLWEPGDAFVDRRIITLPEQVEGELTVYLCLYELGNLQRWPVLLEDGSSASELVLGEIASEDARFAPLW